MIFILKATRIEHIFYFIFIYLNFYIFLTNFIKSIAFLVENDIIYIRNHTLLSLIHISLRELIGILCNALKTRHIGRLQDGTCEFQQGFAFNDLLTNLSLIHI